MAATLLLFCTIGLTVSSFSIYLPYIRGENGFNNTQTSMLMTMRSFTTFLVMFNFDRYYRKVGMRLGITLSLVCLAAAFVSYSFSTSYLTYCLSAVLTGVAGGLSSSTAAALLINSWFKDHKALALGISSAGTGIASILSPLVLVPIIENVSLGTAFRVESLFVFLCAVAVFLIVRNDSPIQLIVKGAPPARKSTPATPVKVEERGSRMIISPFMSVVFMVATFISAVLVYGITACLSLILQPNFSGTDMSRIVSIYGLFLMLGKITYGQLADRIGAFRSNFFMFIMLIAGTGLICVSDTFPMAVAAAACLGFGSPVSNVSVPLYVSDLAKKDHYPKVLKNANMIMNCAGIITTSVAGPIADFFGSYVPVFAGICVLSVICFAMFQLVYLRCGLTGKPKAHN